MMQIELFLELNSGPTVQAIVDYDLTKTPIMNGMGEVGVIINDVEIDNIEYYYENGMRCHHRESDQEETYIKTLILKHHEDLEIKMSIPLEHP